jgi:hypothetical protein
MRYTVVESILQVIGEPWGGGTGSYQYTLKPKDLEQMKRDGVFCREAIQSWVNSKLNTGDFSIVADWRAEIEDGDKTLEFDWSRSRSAEIWDEINWRYD